MKELSFSPDEKLKADLALAMEYRGLTRASDYVRIAVLQLTRRDIAAHNKTRRATATD